MDASQNLLETVGRLYETVFHDDAETAWLDMIRDRVGAEHAVLSETAGTDLFLHCSDIDEDMLPLAHRLAAITMYDPSLAQMPSQAARRMSDYFPLRELIRSDVYQELVRPLSGGHALGFTWSDDTGRTAIAICRDATRAHDFSDTELLMMQPLLLHLHHALAIRSELATLKTALQHAWTALDLIEDGVVIVDRGHRVRYLNATAQSMLHDADSLLADQHGLRAIHAASDRRLQAALRAAARIAPAGRREHSTDMGHLFRSARTTVVIERGPPKRPMLAAAAPATGLARALSCNDFSEAIVLMLRDPDREPAGNVDVMMDAFALTRREAELALALKRGQPLSVCALVLGITEGTARQYLKSIFSKTGVQRQAELVKLLLLTLR